MKLVLLVTIWSMTRFKIIQGQGIGRQTKDSILIDNFKFLGYVPD